MKRWYKMTEEEKVERLAELRENWPSMRNNHPRQKGLPHYNSWKEIDLEKFLLPVLRDVHLPFAIYFY